MPNLSIFDDINLFMKTHLKVITPHAICLSILILINLIYFLPQFQGKQITQGDIVSYNGASVEISEYASKKGEPLFWTNAMFGGMPTYQIWLGYTSNAAEWVMHTYNKILPNPVNTVFLYLLGFFILLRALRMNIWLSILGAIAFADLNFLFSESLILAQNERWRRA